MFFVSFSHCVLMCVTSSYCNMYVLGFVWLRTYVGVPNVSVRICSSHERKMPLKTAFRHVILIDLISVSLYVHIYNHMWSVSLSNLVAIVEAHAAECWQFGLQTVVSWLLLLLLVELLPLDLLPHAPGLLDGLHHCVLVPEQCCGVQAGEDVWGRRKGHENKNHFDWKEKFQRSSV